MILIAIVVTIETYSFFSSFLQFLSCQPYILHEVRSENISLTIGTCATYSNSYILFSTFLAKLEALSNDLGLKRCTSC